MEVSFCLRAMFLLAWVNFDVNFGVKQNSTKFSFKNKLYNI